MLCALFHNCRSGAGKKAVHYMVYEILGPTSALTFDGRCHVLMGELIGGRVTDFGRSRSHH